MKRSQTFLLLILIGFIIYFLYQNVWKGSEPLPETASEAASYYGKSFNNERIQRGQPIIEDSWVLRTDDSTQLLWSEPTTYFISDKADHAWKTIYLTETTAHAETDVFNYFFKDSLANRLHITSYFSVPDSLSFTFSIGYFNQESPAQTIIPSRAFVDSVLTAWDLQVYYQQSN